MKPLDRSINAAVGTGLLDCLIENQMPVSYSCRDGRCGMCTCRVLEGSLVEAGKRDRGVPVSVQTTVLACQSVLAEDCVIQLPDAAEPVVHPSRVVKVPVLAIERSSADVREIRLAHPNPRFAYSPGQHVEIEFTRGLTRRYSLGGLSEDGYLKFNIQRRSEGRAWTFVEEQLAVGAQMRVRGPLGTAYARSTGHKGIVVLAAGVGLAPAISLLRGLAQAEVRVPIAVAIGFQNQAEVYGLEEVEQVLRQLPTARMRLCLAQGRNVPRGVYRGLLTEWLRHEFRELSQWRAYAYGTSLVVESIVRVLKLRGVTDERLHMDAFYAHNL